MIRQTYHLELISPCFCAGADPAKAEIRAPSIRGQLRWWFRVLGGFKSLAPLSVRDQEIQIFGTAAGDDGVSGKLTVRVSNAPIDSEKKDCQELGYKKLGPEAYLTFPLQSRGKNGVVDQYKGRGVLLSGKFQMTLVWRGAQNIAEDFYALASVFGILGSLGFRGRRAMGAVAFAPESQPMTIQNAMQHFQNPKAIQVKSLAASSSSNAIFVLGGWLRAWRAHGRTQDHRNNMQNDQTRPPCNPGFRFAKQDHDIGYEISDGEAFRPALGLPIIQKTCGKNRSWEWDYDANTRRASGRFASPVILRPYRSYDGQWKALVIFVDVLSWPANKKVFIDGKQRAVSKELYRAMQNDPKLTTFC